MAAVRAGDDLAFEALFQRYQRRIAAYVHGMVRDHARAEDVTQEVFLSALRRMRATETPIAFKPWVYEIAKNACIDAFRRSRRAEEVSYDGDDGAERFPLVSAGPTPDAALDTRTSLDHLRGAFGGLSEAHHQILVMRELEGLSYREIGERLGMSRPSVESTLFRARRRLTEEYEELVSGERCRRVQAIIAGAQDARLGARDERRTARHVSHCQSCRRAAAFAGFDLAALARKRGVGAKIAALLPLPAFLKRRLLPDDAPPGAIGGHGATLAQWSAGAAPFADSISGWAKAAAMLAAAAVAGVGAGVATHGSSASPSPVRARPGALTSAPASTPAGRGRSAGSAGGAGTTPLGSASGRGGGASSTSRGPSTTHSAPGEPSRSASGPMDAPATKVPGGADDVVHRAVHDVTGLAPTVTAPTLPLGVSTRDQAPTAPLPDLGKTVSQTTGVLGDAVGGTTKAVGGTVGGTTKTVGDTAGGTTKTVGDTAGGTTKTVGDTAGGTTKTVGDTVSKTTKAVGGTVSGVGAKTGGPVGSTTQAAGSTVSGTGQALGDTVSGAGQLLGDTTTAAGGTVQGVTGAFGKPPGG